MKKILMGLALLSFALPVHADGLMDQAKASFKPLPKSAPALKGNKMSKARVHLGKMLFFDPRLSASQLISCNSCHNLGLGGADLQETSIGHGWAKGPRNAPTVLNSVFHVAQFWDGRAPSLEAQAKGPVQAGVEMNNTPAKVEETLKSMPGYVRAFKKAFPGKNPVSFDNMAKAIALYESTLITPSRFDSYLKGKKNALSRAEKAGLQLFLDKGCATCHNGVGIGGSSYAKFGVVKAPSDTVRPPADKGRYKVTKKSSDEYVFRVPTLRNIALTGPYFHSGKVHDLSEAVTIMAKTQLGVDLTKSQLNYMVIFLKSLNGKVPRTTYPVLPAPSNSTPQPNIAVNGASH